MSLMYTTDEIFWNCSVFNQVKSKREEKFTKCSDISEIQQSIDYFDICFTFFHQNDSQEDQEFELRANHFIDLNFFLLIIVNNKIEEKIMYLVPRKEYQVRDLIGTSYRIKFTHGLKEYFEYPEQVVESLPKPYETNCFDYNSIGFESREHCI